MSETIRSLRPQAWSLAAALLFTACGGDISLPPAQRPVTGQTIVLSAITGTHVTSPSAYTMLDEPQPQEVFTQSTSAFDFVFDLGIDSTFGLGNKGDTIAVLIPRGGVGFVPDGGLQVTFVAFDSIVLAPVSGYENQKPVRFRAGDNILAASRLQRCEFGILSPRYAKMEVINVDVAQRIVQIRVVYDPNCGYRQLSSGIPVR